MRTAVVRGAPSFLSVGMDTCLSLEDNPGVPRFLLSTHRLHVAFFRHGVFARPTFTSPLLYVVVYRVLYRFRGFHSPIHPHSETGVCTCRLELQIFRGAKRFVARSDIRNPSSRKHPGNILAINRIDTLPSLPCVCARPVSFARVGASPCIEGSRALVAASCVGPCKLARYGTM